MNREEFIAQVRHIGWVSFQIAIGQEYNDKPNEDQLISLFDSIKFMDKNPKCTPEKNHENWMKKKISRGWVYGDKKDHILKTNQSLVPFRDLPLVEQKKDVLSIVIHNLADELWDRLSERR